MPLDNSAKALVLPEGAHDPEVVDAQIITEDMPTRQQLILRGRAALAEAGHDPDDWVDVATDEALAAAQSANTLEVIHWGWGRWIWWTGLPNVGRAHLPARPNSVRQYIQDHKTMADPKTGKLRGRYGQPYAPATVELAVYVVSMVHQALGYRNPVDHPKVTAQLLEYSKWWENQGFRPDRAYPLTPADSVRLARSCDLRTVNGLRNATMFRVQFDMGCRASELCHLQMGDVEWVDDDRVLITISRSKTDQAGKGRVVAVEALRPDPDLPRPSDHTWDVDPVRLLTEWYTCLTSFGRSKGPLFPEVNYGPPRADGRIAGSLREAEMNRGAYALAFMRAVAKSGVGVDPRTGKCRNVSTHSNRSGHITAAVDSGMGQEQIAPRTGHSPSSASFQKYFRSSRRWGDANPGTLIRKTQQEDEGAQG